MVMTYEFLKMNNHLYLHYLIVVKHTQFDQNGIVYDPKTGRKCCKRGTFTAVFRVYAVRFRSVLYRIVSVS